MFRVGGGSVEVWDASQFQTIPGMESDSSCCKPRAGVPIHSSIYFARRKRVGGLPTGHLHVIDPKGISRDAGTEVEVLHRDVVFADGVLEGGVKAAPRGLRADDSLAAGGSL